MSDIEQYLDDEDVKMMGNLQDTATVNELCALYYSALTVIAEDNEIDVMQAHTGIELMIANVNDSILPIDTSEELH